MTPLLFDIIVKTIPKAEANAFEDSKLIVKSRKAWKNDIFKYILLTICAAVAFWLTDKLPIPYIGFFFFIFGVFGFLGGALLSIRAFCVYKYYYDLYNEDDIKKIVD